MTTDFAVYLNAQDAGETTVRPNPTAPQIHVIRLGHSDNRVVLHTDDAFREFAAKVREYEATLPPVTA